jgi:hypothetical protein
MSEVQQLTPAGTLDYGSAGPAELSAQIGMVAQRQEELALVVQRLNASAAGFDQLRAYVEQMGEILADLAREVTAIDPVTVRRRLDGLAETMGEVDVLRAEVAAVAQVGAEAAAAQAPVTAAQAPGTAAWLPDLATGDDRSRALQNLGAWVDEVLRVRHPEMYDRLGACWFLHPDVLDEMTALRAAWFAAYRDPAAPATAAIEWHDRWLPGAMRRCRTAIRRRGCKGRHERELAISAPLLDRQEFRNFVRLGSGPDVLVPEAAAVASPAEPPWEPAAEPAAEPAPLAPGAVPDPRPE